MKKQSVFGALLFAVLLFLLPLCALAKEDAPGISDAAEGVQSADDTLRGPADGQSDELTKDASAEEGERSVSYETGEDLLQATSDDVVAIYRLYFPGNGEHLYTTDVNEKDTLFNSYGWGYEGIAWYAADSGTPVYRLYHPGLGNHLYTTDRNEVRVLTAAYGWKTDNGGRALFYSSGSVPIYRVYNKKQSGMHHLTTDVNEYHTLPKYGWTKEGVKIYAQQIGSPITTSYSAATNLARAKSAYRTIVSQNRTTTTYGGNTVFQSYYLHDLNSDGIPELLLKLGAGAAYSHGIAYTYQTTQNKAVRVGSFMTSHTRLYYGNSSHSSGPIRIDFFHQGNYVQYQLSLSGSTLSQTPVLTYSNYYSAFPSNYGALTEYSTNDLTPLN